MFRKIIRELGFALISYGTLFSPILASADDGNAALAAVIGFPVGAVVTGAVLVSMSHTKIKATKADKYTKGSLILHDRSDVYVRTDTSKTKINNN